MFESVKLDFLLVGHTKFSCDSRFGSFKNQLKKNPQITGVKDIFEAVK